jgi:hypothetical protein
VNCKVFGGKIYTLLKYREIMRGSHNTAINLKNKKRMTLKLSRKTDVFKREAQVDNIQVAMANRV